MDDWYRLIADHPGPLVMVSGFRDEYAGPERSWLERNPTVRILADGPDLAVALPHPLGWWIDPASRLNGWYVNAVRSLTPEELAAYRLSRLAGGGL
jgi:hypothetical protein